MVYLNFCSIKSGNDDEAWKDHFENQSVDEWVPHCCKENVLKYIWRITHPPFGCTVMVSLVVKHMKEDDSVSDYLYHGLFKSTLGDYITGLGFLCLLRKDDLFDAEIVSVRSEDGIVWDDSDKRKPKRVKSGKLGHPFVTLLVKPKDDNTEEELDKLQKKFRKWKIADLREDEMQKGAIVKVVKGDYKGLQGIITKRTVAQLTIKAPITVFKRYCERVCTSSSEDSEIKVVKEKYKGKVGKIIRETSRNVTIEVPFTVRLKSCERVGTSSSEDEDTYDEA